MCQGSLSAVHAQKTSESVPVKKVEQRRMGRTLLLGVVLGVVGFVGNEAGFPMPLSFTEGTFMERADARLSYYWQAFQHVTGFRETFDKEWLQEKYIKLLPKDTTRETYKHAPKFDAIYELDAEDPDWKAKFEAYYRNPWVAKTPVVVRKLSHVDTEHFPGVKDWNLDFFKDHVYQDRSIPVFTNCTLDKSVVFQPFSQFAEEMKDKSKVRYARCVSDYDGLLAPGINTKYVANLTGKSVEHTTVVAVEGRDTHCAFIGGTHVHSRMHSDFGFSAFFQIQGRKRWTFFPPSESALLYPNAHRYNVAYNADLDIFAPDFDTHFLHGALQGYRVEISPGDVLFFPSFWWHAVQNLDDITIGIDFAVVDIVASWKVNAILLLGSIFNINMILEVLNGVLFKAEGSIKDVFFSYYSKDSNFSVY